MKEIRILMVLLIAFICIGTTSCTKDENGKDDKENVDNEDEDQASIVGTWKLNDGDGLTIVFKKLTLEYEEEKEVSREIYTRQYILRNRL